MTTIEDIAAAIAAGRFKNIADLVADALAGGLDPLEVLNRGMIDAMSLVGERFSRGEAFVPEMLVSARTMKRGVEALKPHLAAGAAGMNGKVVIGTVQGDMHDIGKNLVAMMLESAGFEVVDLGADVPANRFIEALQANGDVRLVALSTLLTTTMPSMQQIVTELNQLETRDSFRVMVGGAPVTAEFAARIGADAYADDAASAASSAKTLLARTH